MKKNLGYIAFILLFFLLCLIPSVGMLAAGQSQAGGNEVLAALPALRDGEGRLNTDYLSQLSDYMEDNYFSRQRLVTAWSALNVRALHTSISEDVVLGSDGWLYFGQTLDDYTGSELLSDREIECAARNLALMQEYCQESGADFLFTIAPNKNSLYPEHMPELAVFSDQRNAARLLQALEREGVGFADLFSAFFAQEEPLYFTQDSHWNSKGAALAADAISAALERESSYFSGPFTSVDDHRSDLYDMLFPSGTWLETDQKYAGELTFSYDVPIRSAENLTIMTTGGGQGSLLMFRDSFGNLLYPYLADSFASALFSRSVPYKLNLVQERAADCVVIELVERNINYLIENVPLMPAPLREPLDAVSLDITVALDTEPATSLPGYVLVSGTLPIQPQSGSPLCLSTAVGCYEAFLLEDDGFGLYIPEAALTAGPMSLQLTAESGLVSVPAAT